ncbi:hypothetical protein [Glycomyces tenuis]|uniref:hypothetical protein n=1 Tax=Glycomyces tenuis TaxID=58116 RepID=UPI0004208830|nr:hypothetical protein [Glycomyces tenuis]
MVQIDSRAPVPEPVRARASAEAESALPADHADAADKVGALVFLSDDVHVTTERVARFYEVPVEDVRGLIRQHRRELQAAGLTALRGERLRAFKGRHAGRLSEHDLRSSQLTVWSRGAVLAAGQLLPDSPVAAQVRRFLLSAEESAAVDRRLETARFTRFQERADYRGVLHSLKLGGAVSEDYRLIQNTLYAGLFGMTAAVIRESRVQRDGDRKRDGSFTAASARIAKNYLTENELELLDNVTVTINAQLNIKYPRGATVDQMLGVVYNAVALFRPRILRATA